MRKRVLLVSTWVRETEPRGNFLSPPMGLYRIQHWLENKHDVDVLDTRLDDPVSFLDKAAAYDVIGFSPTRDHLHDDIALARFARKRFPEATLIAGGVEATANYQKLLDLGMVDFVIMGEGEKALEWFLDGRMDISLAPSTVTRRFRYETVLQPDELAHATDLDFRRLRLEEYWKKNEAVCGGDIRLRNCVTLYVTTYCPQGCKFCSTTHFVRQACPPAARVVSIPALRLVSILHKVMEQIPDTKTIFFHDDNACHDRENTRQWCRIWAQEGEKVSFVATSRLDHFDVETLEIMREAGFRKVAVGVEAYSDSLLRKLGKGLSTREVDAFLDRTAALGFPVQINLMLCQPEATLDDVKATAEFCLRVLDRHPENTVSVAPFIRAYVGSWYYDNWDLIEYRYATVPSIRGTKSETIRVPYRFLPRDPEVRSLMYRIDEALEHGEPFASIRQKPYLSTQMSRPLCEFVLEVT
ncbi:MAG: B12-binding domain-containing radical SAM protein [Kiritimatiellae bacterium]|nr:B12-binding domain-containing radical SAM protein [Kiritimatiellia bacterium]